MQPAVRPIPPGELYMPFARAFDAAAPTYDRDYGCANIIMSAFRTRSLTVLDATLPREGLLLELGCGTGVEAAALARSARGRHIVATDLSAAMLAQAEARARAEGVPRQLDFRQWAAGEVGEIRRELGVRAFAGAYSSFGALNCEPDLRMVAAGLAAVLAPGAPLIVSVINRYCVWELAWYMAHGDVARAGRRLRAPGAGRPSSSPGPVFSQDWEKTGSEESGSLTLSSLPITYLSPGRVASAFAPWFTVALQEGMGVALPPPSLSPWLTRRPRLFRLLQGAEARVRGLPGVSWFGDHILMVLQRTDAEAA